MTRCPLVVLCTAPKSSSADAVEAIVTRISDTDATLVVVAPVGSEVPAAYPSFTYQSRSILGTAVDSLVRQLDDPGRTIRARLGRGAASVARRKARPVAQVVDRSVTPLPDRAAMTELLDWIEMQRSGDRPVYIAYTDGWALPLAVELTGSIPCAGSGSVEMVSKLLDSLGRSSGRET